MTKTANLNLNKPERGTVDWEIPVNENWDILDSAVSGKQDTLVSGTNIKTVQGQSLLGAGDISVDALPNQEGNAGKFLTTNGTAASWAEAKSVITYSNGTLVIS